MARPPAMGILWVALMFGLASAESPSGSTAKTEREQLRIDLKTCKAEVAMLTSALQDAELAIDTATRVKTTGGHLYAALELVGAEAYDMTAVLSSRTLWWLNKTLASAYTTASDTLGAGKVGKEALSAWEEAAGASRAASARASHWYKSRGVQLATHAVAAVEEATGVQLMSKDKADAPVVFFALITAALLVSYVLRRLMAGAPPPPPPPSRPMNYKTLAELSSSTTAGSPKKFKGGSSTVSSPRAKMAAGIVTPAPAPPSAYSMPARSSPMGSRHSSPRGARPSPPSLPSARGYLPPSRPTAAAGYQPVTNKTFGAYRSSPARARPGSSMPPSSTGDVTPKRLSMSSMTSAVSAATTSSRVAGHASPRRAYSPRRTSLPPAGPSSTSVSSLGRAAGVTPRASGGASASATPTAKTSSLTSARYASTSQTHASYTPGRGAPAATPRAAGRASPRVMSPGRLPPSRQAQGTPRGRSSSPYHSRMASSVSRPVTSMATASRSQSATRFASPRR